MKKTLLFLLTALSFGFVSCSKTQANIPKNGYNAYVETVKDEDFEQYLKVDYVYIKNDAQNTVYYQGNYNSGEKKGWNFYFDYDVKTKSVYDVDDSSGYESAYKLINSDACVSYGTILNNHAINPVIDVDTYDAKEEGIEYTFPDENTATVSGVDADLISKSVVLPEEVSGHKVKTIGKSAFSNCNVLENITIPDTITSIEDYAFYGCRSLKSIAIPETIKRIESNVFKNCIKLSEVTIPSSVTSIAENVFEGCKSLTSISLPSGIMSIGSSAFKDCTGLTAITLPDSVTSIENYTFEGCTNLTDISYSEKLGSIGYKAFEGCSSLTAITLTEGITNIGESAFAGSGLQTVTIPSSIVSIGNTTFSNCSALSSVILPSSVTSIKSGAFYNCISLTKITYQGTMEKWKTVFLGTDWDYSTGSYVIHCNDGDIAKS